MNGADNRGGPRVPKPLDSEAPRARAAKPVAAEKRAPPAFVDFSGSDAALLKQLAALQAQMAELRTARAVVACHRHLSETTDCVLRRLRP